MPRRRLTAYAVLVRFASMLAVWVVLLNWSVYASRVGCAGAFVVFLLIGGCVLLSSAEDAFLHHRAMVSACMRREARLLRLIHGRGMLLIRHVLMSAALTVALMVAALLLVPRQWSLIFLDLLLLTLLLPKLSAGAGVSVRGQYRFAMARNWATWLSILLIWADSMLALLLAPEFNFTGQRWQAVVAFDVQPSDVGCGLLRGIADVAATGHGLAYWAAQNFGRAMHIPTQATMAWVGLLVIAVFPFIFAFAISRALVGTMARPREMWNEMIDDFRAPPGQAPSPPPAVDRRARGGGRK